MEIEEIQELITSTYAHIRHVFREANQLADKMANEAYNQQGLIQWENFQQLSGACKGILNADKSRIPTLRIKTRRIFTLDAQD